MQERERERMFNSEKKNKVENSGAVLERTLCDREVTGSSLIKRAGPGGDLVQVTISTLLHRLWLHKPENFSNNEWKANKLITKMYNTQEQINETCSSILCSSGHYKSYCKLWIIRYPQIHEPCLEHMQENTVLHAVADIVNLGSFVYQCTGPACKMAWHELNETYLCISTAKTCPQCVALFSLVEYKRNQKSNISIVELSRWCQSQTSNKE